MRISDWSSDVCSSDLFSRIRRIYGLCKHMIENQTIRPSNVIGPLGEPLPLDSLPPRDTTRSVVRRKAAVVGAVSGGLLSDRQSVAWGRSVSVRVDIGSCRLNENKTKTNKYVKKRNK